MIFRSPSASREDEEAFGLSGWLYADLLLGLAVIFLAAAFFISQDDDHISSPVTTTTPIDEVGRLEAELKDSEEERSELEAQLEDQRQGAQEANESIEDLQAEVDELLDEKRTVSVQLSEVVRQRDELLSQAPPGVEQIHYCFRVLNVDQQDEESSRTGLDSALRRLGIADRTAGIALSFGVSEESTGPGEANARWFNNQILKAHPAFSQAVLREFWNGRPAGDVKPEGSVKVDVYLMAEPDRAAPSAQSGVGC